MNFFDSKHIDSLIPSFLSAGKVVAVMHGANAPMMKVRTGVNLFNSRSDLQKSCHWRCGHQNSGHKKCDRHVYPDMEFFQKFTPPDFQAKNFTPSISPNFNSFSKKKHKK